MNTTPSIGYLHHHVQELNEKRIVFSVRRGDSNACGKGILKVSGTPGGPVTVTIQVLPACDLRSDWELLKLAEREVHLIERRIGSHEVDFQLFASGAAAL